MRRTVKKLEEMGVELGPHLSDNRKIEYIDELLAEMRLAMVDQLHWATGFRCVAFAEKVG